MEAGAWTLKGAAAEVVEGHGAECEREGAAGCVTGLVGGRVEVCRGGSRETVVVERPVGRIRLELDPAPPLARLKVSSNGVVGPTPAEAVTTAVAELEAVVVPAVLLAVSASRIVKPTSP